MQYLKYPLIIGLLLSGLFQSLSAAMESQAAQQALQQQLDEERLAYQLYTALGETYPELRPFQNIPKAEARHYSALQAYANEQHPELPTHELTGKFLFPETQALYDQLLKEGQASAAAALQVGVQVEKKDIEDIDAALAITEDPALRAIYMRLKEGSERHLAAFSGQGGRQGKGKQKGPGCGACRRSS